MKRYAKIENITWGLFMIAIGLLFLIHNFHPEWMKIADILRLWPVLIIIIGLNILVRFFGK